MKLLGRLTSINVRKVMWTAAQLGLELDREDWGAGFRSPQEAGYLALNPNGLIPVLIDGGFTLWESNSICRYLAAKAGATFISPFIGRLDDINLDGMDLIAEIRQIYDNYHFSTEILAASIRTVNHVKDCALVGADVATMPPDVIRKLADHVLTAKGLEAFMKDWAKTGQNILN